MKKRRRRDKMRTMQKKQTRLPKQRRRSRKYPREEDQADRLKSDQQDGEHLNQALRTSPSLERRHDVDEEGGVQEAGEEGFVGELGEAVLGLPTRRVYP